MMTKKFSSLVSLLAALTALAGCGEASTDLQVERLPDVQPNLPSVPTLPPPPYPTTLPDSSYTVYGLRARLSQTVNNEQHVTGYVVDIYVPPDCNPREPDCRVLAPHFWVADARIPEGEVGDRRDEQLMIVGYAENQQQIDEAIEDHERGREPEVDPTTGRLVETGMYPIPVDLHIGNKIKLRGRFTRMSSAGFNNSEGLLDYFGHETLENVAEEED